MQFIGRIDIEIYKCVSDNIITDEVIITEKQVEHINQKHSNIYDEYKEYFEEIIS